MSDEEKGSGDCGELQLGSAAEATVMAYHQLAMDSDKRLHLALDDTCLQFLSLVIGNGDNGLVTKALNTLSALAESPECRAPMASTFGVLHCLKASVEEENEHTDEIKTQAAELFTCLNFAYHQQRAARRRSRMPENVPSSPNTTSDKANDSYTNTTSAAGTSSATAITSEIKSKKKSEEKSSSLASIQEKKSEPDNEVKTDTLKNDKDTDRGRLVKSDSIESNCSSVSVSSCSQPSQKTQKHRSQPNDEGRNKYYRDPKHRTRMVTLHVKGMLTQTDRAAVEGALVRVRGVISLVFDLSKSRISCRVRRVLDLSKLGAAIDSINSDMMLFQVVSKNQGEEIEVPLSKAKTCSDSPVRAASPIAEDELPEYLPEDEDDDCQPEDDPKSAVATTGVVLKEAATSLFSAAASLLQQSFYW